MFKHLVTRLNIGRRQRIRVLDLQNAYKFWNYSTHTGFGIGDECDFVILVLRANADDPNLAKKELNLRIWF